VNNSNMQKISVAWNNCFRRIFFMLLERKRKTTIQYFCHTRPIPYLLHQKKLYCSDSVVLQSLSRRMHQASIAVSSLYNVLSPKLWNNSENWFGTNLPWMWTCDLRHIISVFLTFLFRCSCVHYCLYNYISGCHLA